MSKYIFNLLKLKLNKCNQYLFLKNIPLIRPKRRPPINIPALLDLLDIILPPLDCIGFQGLMNNHLGFEKEFCLFHSYIASLHCIQ